MQLKVLYSLDTVEPLHMSRVNTCLDLSKYHHTPHPPLKVHYWIRSPICLLCGENYRTLIHQIFSRIATSESRKYTWCAYIPLLVVYDQFLKLKIILEGTQLYIFDSWFIPIVPIEESRKTQDKMLWTEFAAENCHSPKPSFNVWFLAFELIWFLHSSWQRTL